MTRLFTTGYETGLTSAEYVVTGSFAVATTSARTGTYGMRYAGTNLVAAVSHYYLASQEVYAGFAFLLNTTSGASFFLRSASTNVVELRPGASETMGIYLNGSLADTLSAGAWLSGLWNYVEIGISRSATVGWLEVKINGTSVYRFDGNTGAGTTDNFYCTANFISGGLSCTLDDVVINNNVGVHNNTWPGQVKLHPIAVSGVGSAADLLRGGVDSGANWSQVSPIPASATGYVYSSTEDERDLYATAGGFTLSEGRTVNNIIVVVVSKIESGSGAITASLKSGTTETEHDTPINQNGSYLSYTFPFPVDPDGNVPWVESKINSVEIGAKIKAGI
jgi:hypothetical protein